MNGVAVFARGAVWTPVDWLGLAPSEAELRAAVETARQAGMNILRVPGTAAYETAAFHDLCDELGMLVWQDFMFANLDYPIADEAFRALVESEVAQVASRLAGRPSTVVFCGNSEVEQQVAMFGLEPALGRGELFGELLPAALEAAGADAVYVPSAPCGGDLPFRPDRGVANYYGVGGYRRPLEDARRADVRFAAECLAFANVPSEDAVDRLMGGRPGDVAIHHPAWKAGVPRDVGNGWDFDDVRDHYLGAALRRRSGRAAPGRQPAVPRPVAGGHGRDDGRGVRRVAARRQPLRGRHRPLAARPGRRRGLGRRRRAGRSQGRVPPPPPGAGAGRRLDHRRGARRHRRARRQRWRGAAPGRACG